MELTVHDLRRLSRFGNVTAKMDHTYEYKIALVKKNGLYLPYPNSYVDGKRSLIHICEPFTKSWAHIQTVKQGKYLVAERRLGMLQVTMKYEERLLEERKGR